MVHASQVFPPKFDTPVCTVQIYSTATVIAPVSTFRGISDDRRS